MLIYQITDLHIPGQDDERWTEVSNNILAIMAYVSAYPPDLLVITGDLSMRDGDEKACAWLHQILPKHQDYALIPGNHDDPELLDRVFTDRVGAQHGFFFKLAKPEADLIFVNSSDEWLPDEQLAFIDGLPKDKSSLLFIHHPPDLISDGFMANSQPLQNWQAVAGAVGNSSITHVFCGHYHNAIDKDCDGFILHLTPSPAFQISLSARHFELEPVVPQIRVIDCQPDHIETYLKPVPSL